MIKIDTAKWEYLGTDDVGTKVYISINSKNKFKYMEIDTEGHIKYHN